MDLLEKSKLQKELNDDLSPGLLRQRRNLMVVSLIIIFMEISGAQLGNVSLLGISITFDKPESISWFLMIFLVYFFYRYTLYFVQEGHSFYSLFCHHAKQKTWSKIQSIQDEKIPDAKLKTGLVSFCDLDKVSFLRRRISSRSHFDPTTGNSETIKEIDFNIGLLWKELLSAVLIVLFKERFVTDYYMPLLIALVAVCLKFL